MDVKYQSEENKNNDIPERKFQENPLISTSTYIGTEPVEIVQGYTYLGTRLTPTGNFPLKLEHLKLKENALHDFSSIRKHTLLNRLNRHTASQLFDTMIFLILSYNSEIGGMYIKHWEF